MNIGLQKCSYSVTHPLAPLQKSLELLRKTISNIKFRFLTTFSTYNLTNERIKRPIHHTLSASPIVQASNVSIFPLFCMPPCKTARHYSRLYYAQNSHLMMHSNGQQHREEREQEHSFGLVASKRSSVRKHTYIKRRIIQHGYVVPPSIGIFA